MKINIEAQTICNPKLRGIPYYTLNIIKSLLKRNKGINYSISYFDYLNERGNRKYVEQYLLADYPDLCTYECNTLNYKDIMSACISDNFSAYGRKYDEYLGCDADVFHFPDSPCFPYAISKNIVVTIHDIMPILFENKGYWTDAVIQRFKNCHNYIASHDEITVIADSECTKKDITEHLNIDPDRIFVTPLGYDDETHFHESNSSVLSELGVNSPYLLYLGALDMRKGIFDILRAFNIVKLKYSGLKLVLSGKIDTMFEKQYKDHLEGISLNDVIFTGYVTDEQKRILLSSAEAFLFPSEYEGFGLPVLEAMACGAPVITTNVSSLPEVGGDAVVYVSPNQPEELAEQIRTLLDSRALREKYIAKGYERAKVFSWDKTAELTEEVYKIAYDRTH